jgi:hypothetical protein
MHPFLRLSIPCGLVGHQSSDLASAPHLQRHPPGHPPYYGKRYLAGDRIRTGFVESTANRVISKRFCARQQMQ